MENHPEVQAASETEEVEAVLEIEEVEVESDSEAATAEIDHHSAETTTGTGSTIDGENAPEATTETAEDSKLSLGFYQL